MRTLYHSFLFVMTIAFSGTYGVSQEKLEIEHEIPILAWHGIPEAETTIERFEELKQAGFGINFTFYSSIEALEKALDIAHAVGVKVLAACPELKLDPEVTVRRLMEHPALAGYYLRDEPNATDFKELGEWAKKIQSIDVNHYIYINLFPTYAGPTQLFADDYQLEGGKNIYTAHVEQFVEEVPVPFISFDHYPVIENEDGVKTLRSTFYENLEIISQVSAENNLPFWAFSLAVAHKPYPVPTVGEMKLQQYSNLAYGAQVLQYFTYWTPISTTWDFHNGPITADGRRTIVYDRIKFINQEIQNRAAVFLDAKLISVGHTGRNIPQGTSRIYRLPEPVKVLETSEEGAIVSLLEKDDHQFMVIVNRDFQNSMSLTFVGDESVKMVQKDGTLVSANKYVSTIQIDPGDAAIYTWRAAK